MDTPSYITLDINSIRERYADLRIIQPQAERAMEKSLLRYGQMTPVIVGAQDGNSYEMVDGFKRLRAGRKLKHTSINATILPGNSRTLKVAIIHLNTKARSIADLETAMVIRSLFRDDGLSQVEIATLLGRHKSFVCRRLQIIENLTDEVLEHLKLGLIHITHGRELARLPHGNQDKALSLIMKHRFSTAETSRLVDRLLNEPRWNRDSILEFPEDILIDRQPQRPHRSSFCGRLLKIERLLTRLSEAKIDQSQYSDSEMVINRIQKTVEKIQTRLNELRSEECF